MNRTAVIVCILVLPLLNGCYIQRYYEAKKTYEDFRKEAGKSRSANTRLLAQRQAKADSIRMVSSASQQLRIAIVHSDSMPEVYTLAIRKALGEEPWGDSVMKAANTALPASYMSKNEQQVIYWLNLARMQPDLFAELCLDPYLGIHRNDRWECCGEGGWGMGMNVVYLNTCYLEMAKMSSLNALKPGEKCYRSAECHAIESGRTGYVGHERNGCTKYFSGECCYYGSDDARHVITNLLVDNGVPSLGHRHICLGSYSAIGVSQKPHSTYRVNTVLDFE